MTSRIEAIQYMDRELKYQFLKAKGGQVNNSPASAFPNSTTSTISTTSSPDSPPYLSEEEEKKSVNEPILNQPRSDSEQDDSSWFKNFEEDYLTWLQRQNSVLYMQFIELISEELNDDYFNKITSTNHFLHFTAILIATISASSDYAMAASGQSGMALGVLSTTLEFVLNKIAMPAALLTLIVGGVTDVYQAYTDENTLDRTFSIVEGVYRASLGTFALCISLGVSVASPFVMPSLFLGITLGMAVKEYRQYTHARDEIKKLEDKNKADKNELKHIQLLLSPSSSQNVSAENVSVENVSAKDPEEIKKLQLQLLQLQMRIAKTTQEIEILTVRKDSAKRSMAITLGIGLTSIAFFVAAAAVPPLAPLFTVIGLALFLTMNRVITAEKKKMVGKIEDIKFKQLPETGQELAAFRERDNGSITLTKQQFNENNRLSGLSIFAKQKDKCVVELNRLTTFRKASAPAA